MKKIPRIGWLLALLPVSALALINLTYTPVDLMRDCGQVYVLRLQAAKDGKLPGELVETLAGEAPAAKTFTFDYSGANELPEEKLAGTEGALAVMCIQKRKQDGARVGALEFGTTWVGLTQDGDQWKMDKDSNDLETVWGGSARQLVPAIRYTLAEPGAEFPVKANLTWAGDLALGQLTGKANGCLLTSDGVVVLSAGGDRIFQPGKPPTDVTEKLGLTSKSKAMQAGDFNGDGRLDLASWDGSKWWLLLRGEDGKFGPPVADDGKVRAVNNTALPAAAQNALAIVAGDFDSDGQLDYMVGGKDGTALWSRDAKGQWQASTAETGELGVGASGAISALSGCDLNGDGRQAVAMFHAAASPALFFNRGFACFGAARTLSFTECELPAAKALGAGQQTGIIADLNGDNVPDLLAVDQQQKVWAMFTAAAEPRRFHLTIENTGKETLTVTVAAGTRTLGMYVVRPGEPTAVGVAKAGKLTLRYQTADGKGVSKDVVVVGATRVKL